MTVGYPIQHWSHSSLVSFLGNPLAWYKRYVEGVYDSLSSPASVIGRAGHLALEHFYKGSDKETAVAAGLAYLRGFPDFELNFGKAKSARARKEKRAKMEQEYLQAISFYLARPPRHKVLGAEVKVVAQVEGLPLPLKAVSDLVVESRVKKGALDIIDHKFVDSFSALGGAKSLFALQAIFNYYTVRSHFGRPVERFIVYECKKTKNKNGAAQVRRYILSYADIADDFRVFHKLIADASQEIARERLYLPNPSDMFEGENSFDIYRLGLVD
ncbi:PD-(D/E)XK nuclease family protein [Candidatus Parcubacteria bacterium]|nr:PD-(D/E)XK nuclease family protein [Candidatus Parcubacteria bacterium]